MANKFELPSDPKLAGKILESEHASRLAEMGRIGVWFGSRDNAIIYIAALIIIFSMIGAAVLAGFDDGRSALRGDMAKALAALALSALGYMFGSISRHSPPR